MNDDHDTSGRDAADAAKDWIYRDSTKRLLMRGLLLACAASVLLELFVLGRKGKFGVDGIFGFYAFLGFTCCSAMIFGAKLLGFVLKVPTDHYDRGRPGGNGNGDGDGDGDGGGGDGGDGGDGGAEMTADREEGGA